MGWLREQGLPEEGLPARETEGRGFEGQDGASCFFLGPLSWLWTWSQGAESAVLWFTFLSP